MPRAELPHRGPDRFNLRFAVNFVDGAWPGKLPKRPRRKGGEPEREPVEPPRPKDLSGGAAAPLEFDA